MCEVFGGPIEAIVDRVAAGTGITAVGFDSIDAGGLRAMVGDELGD